MYIHTRCYWIAAFSFQDILSWTKQLFKGKFGPDRMMVVPKDKVNQGITRILVLQYSKETMNFIQI